MLNLSIIVTIYNIEKYLEKCIHSIMENWSDSYELILVNDGSTDSCPLICNHFQTRYPFIKVIHQVNAGLSEARNTGLLMATGKYILFIDGDDFINSNTLFSAMAIAKEYAPDIIALNAVLYYSPNKIIPMPSRNFLNIRLYGSEEYLLLNLKHDTMSMCVPYNIYRRDLLLEHELFFLKDILHEDQLWTPQVFLKASTVYYSGIEFYNHFMRLGSISLSTNQEKNALDLIYICETLCTIYHSLPKPLSKELLDYNAMIYLGAVERGGLHRLPYRDKIHRSYPLKNSFKFKTRLKSLLFFCNIHLFYVLYHHYRLSKNS